MIDLGRGLAAAAWLITAACGALSRPGAVAELRAPDGAVAGHAKLIGRRGGVVVRIQVEGLAPGAHGAHIHAVPACVPPDFLSAGDHFDHSGAGHGHAGPGEHHAGDLPNLIVGSDGRGSMDAMIAGVTLTGTGSHSLFRDGGTSLVIHEREDDMISQPSGGSGRRIACGVIRPAR